MNVSVDVIAEDVWKTMIEYDDGIAIIYSDGDTRRWQFHENNSIFGDEFPILQVREGIATPPNMALDIKRLGEMVAGLQD